MNFLNVLKEFKEASGRRDLVGDNGEDLGAGRFINAAQRILDQKQTTPKSLARHTVRLAAGAYFVAIRGLRVADEVWLTTGTGRVRLARKDASWLREQYSGLFPGIDETIRPPVTNIATSGLGTPAFWAPVPIGLSPRQNADQSDEFGFRDDMDAVVAGDHYDTVGILVMPPTDAVRTVSVIGRFWSPWLAQPEDQSYWTVEQPTALVLAACWVLEMYYRNTQGARDYQAGLEEILMGIHRDGALQDSAEVYKMEG